MKDYKENGRNVTPEERKCLVQLKFKNEIYSEIVAKYKKSIFERMLRKSKTVISKENLLMPVNKETEFRTNISDMSNYGINIEGQARVNVNKTKEDERLV